VEQAAGNLLPLAHYLAVNELHIIAGPQSFIRLRNKGRRVAFVSPPELQRRQYRTWC
jgi:hypothetical protein